MNCSKCGKVTPDTAKFCITCGTRLTAKSFQYIEKIIGVFIIIVMIVIFFKITKDKEEKKHIDRMVTNAIIQSANGAQRQSEIMSDIKNKCGELNLLSDKLNFSDVARYKLNLLDSSEVKDSAIIKASNLFGEIKSLRNSLKQVSKVNYGIDNSMIKASAFEAASHAVPLYSPEEQKQFILFQLAEYKEISLMCVLR